MVEVIDVRYIEEYKLDLTFSNDVSKIVDLKEKILLGKDPMYEPLKDIEFFKKVRVDKELGTVLWPNEFDICPDLLYEM